MYPDTYDRYFEMYYGALFTTPQDKGTLSYTIGAINRARLTNTLSVLPAAFYNCSALGGGIAKGHSREDGTVDYLPRDDLSRCIEGMRALMAATHEYVQLLSKGPSPSCTKACGQSWRSSLDRLQRDWLVLMRNDPLRGALDQGILLWNLLPKIFRVDGTESLLGKKAKPTRNVCSSTFMVQSYLMLLS